MSEEFEKIDRELSERLKKDGAWKVPEPLLDQVSAGVDRAIREKAAPAPARPRRAVPAWIPALAVLLLAVVTVVKLPDTESVTETETGTGEAVVSGETAELSSDIEILRELGAWTEADEADLELS